MRLAVSVCPNYLYDGQTDTANLLIDVLRINICHATDIINDSHESCLKMRRVNVILAGHPSDKLLRIVTFWMSHCFYHLFHQRFHDSITRQFHIQYRFAAIDLLIGSGKVKVYEGVIVLCDKEFKSDFVIGLFFQKAIESSDLFTDRQFLKEVLSNV